MIVPSYLQVWHENFGQLVRDAARIIVASDVPLQRCANDGAPATANERDGIRINYVGAEDYYDDFVMTKNNCGRNSVKTQREPYNAVICSILIRAKVLMGDALKIR